MKKKVIRAFSAVFLTGFTLVIAGILAFFILIVAGASPKLQTIWICSAMRTMSHKYLATAFFSDEYIDGIMKANEIDDSGYDSDILDFSGKDTETEPETEPAPESAPAVVPDPETETEAAPETEPDIPEETEPETELSEETETETETEPETESETIPETEPETEAETEKKPPSSYSQETDEIPELPAETEGDYISEGYEMLEEGLYVKEVSGLTWRGYVMLIEDPMRVKLVDTSMQYTCGENVMTMTKNAGAVAGINGGGFQDGANYDSNGGTPAGLLIEDSKIVYPLEIDDTVYNMIGINDGGALVLRHCTAQWALDNNIVSAVSFAPFLVVNGEGLIKTGSGGWGIAPRTAIGQRETGEFLFLVIDGRQANWSIGCDLDVLQEVMLAEKAYNAAMLDGGSSTAMVYAGEYINRPSLGHERWINNSFVVMPSE
ncbi:MAG: phosphodiester glycosidase family protein [Clostridia bacterium]|nr:phosphodiester glycosidase family protein [Clostridia bacterium]